MHRQRWYRELKPCLNSYFNNTKSLELASLLRPPESYVHLALPYPAPAVNPFCYHYVESMFKAESDEQQLC